MDETSEIMQRKIKAGEREAVHAMEEVTKRNVDSAIEFGNETRKMVHDLQTSFETVKNNMVNLQSLLDETRRQLAILQQKSCSKGTKKYGD